MMIRFCLIYPRRLGKKPTCSKCFRPKLLGPNTKTNNSCIFLISYFIQITLKKKQKKQQQTNLLMHHLLLLLWRILNGRGLPNCLTNLPSLKCLSSSLHSRDSHPFANVLRPSPSGSSSASPTLTCALQE